MRVLYPDRGRNAIVCTKSKREFLVYSHSSCLETKGHLIKIKNLYTGLIPEVERFINDYDVLGAKIFNFIKYVENNWQT